MFLDLKGLHCSCNGVPEEGVRQSHAGKQQEFVPDVCRWLLGKLGFQLRRGGDQYTPLARFLPPSPKRAQLTPPPP